MKAKIVINHYALSKKWTRRVPIIKKISSKTLKYMLSYFIQSKVYNLNIILTDKNNIKKLNKTYRNKEKDTDVLTFVNKSYNKNVGKNYYCDIFFSIDKIENFLKDSKINFYEHFNHLLIHSFLHINGYEHKTSNGNKLMKKIEILIMKKLGFENPYNN